MSWNSRDEIDSSRRDLLRHLAWITSGLLVGAFSQPVALAGKRSNRKKTKASARQANRAYSTYELAPDGSPLIGRTHWVSASAEDTLLDIGRRFDLGYWDMVLANPGIDIWMPGAGRRILLASEFILPAAPREGIVINIPELRLYYYPPPSPGKPRQVVTHPVGLGRQDWDIPLGHTRVVDKLKHPAWYPPPSIRTEHAAQGDKLPPIVAPGPDNPLGQYALLLGVPGYLIHGTNKPYGVGMRVSHGCVRLYPEDIASLFAQVTRDIPVRIISQPYKIAWDKGRLLLEVQPLPGTEDFTGLEPRNHLAMLSRLRHDVEQTAHAAGFTVARREFELMLRRFSGIPELVPLL